MSLLRRGNFHSRRNTL